MKSDVRRDERRRACASAAAMALSSCLALVAGPLAAQEDPHANCAAMGWVPREILARPLPLRHGVGNNSERVSTSSEEAQAFYDQGLNYLHGYVWIEAARSFNQALRHDPDLAMAYVGLSRVYSGLDDPAAAREALEAAVARAATASPREQRRVALRAKQLDAIDDVANPVEHEEYRRALEEALAADVDEAELWLLAGNAQEPTAAGRGQRGGAASTAFYHEALRFFPDNAAAHHYLTHSYETIGQIARALEHGEAYARGAPQIPHAHHMWGHDLRRVGRIDDAIAAFTRSDELERAYYEAERIPPGLDWHHVHNLDLLATAYQHKGRVRRAEELLKDAASLPPVTEYQEYNHRQLTAFYLSRGRWEQALSAARSLQSGKWASTRAVGHAFAGHALLASGRVAEARAALAQAQAALTEVTTVPAGITPKQGGVRPYVETLAAELLLRTGDRAEGHALMKDVARALRAVPGPDAWIQALFRIESMAAIARAAGDWPLAEHLARELIDHDAAYGGSHLALALVALERGDRATTERELDAAAFHWRDADPDLPELQAIRSRRASSP